MSIGLVVSLFFWCVMWLVVGLLMDLRTRAGMNAGTLMLLLVVGTSAWLADAMLEVYFYLGVPAYLGGIIIISTIDYFHANFLNGRPD